MVQRRWRYSGVNQRKPLESPEYCFLRNGWDVQHYGLYTSPLGDVARIIEKWFYRTNCYRKIKVMKLGVDEEECQRFPVKLMFTGMVDRAISHCAFNGQYLWREWARENITASALRISFFNDAIINSEIKIGKCYQNILDLHITISELKIFYI